MTKVVESVAAESLEVEKGDPKVTKGEQSDSGSLASSLHYLNVEHQFPKDLLNQISSGDESWLGKIRSKLRHKMLCFFGLQSYFEKQTKYQAELARCLNNISKRQARQERIEREDLSVSFHALEKSLFEKLAVYSEREKVAKNDSHERQLEAIEKLKTLETVVRGLERIVSLSSRPPVVREDGTDSISSNEIDYRYLLLENRYRGSEEQIRSRVEIYAEVFRGKGVKRPILEVGSGRGELQEVFKEAGIRSYGVELDAAMVATCEHKGLDVRLTGLQPHMETLEDDALDGVIALQLVEHLQVDELQSFLKLCRQKVKKGGRIVFETINTRSMVALCQNYFRDPTHTAPLHPDTLKEVIEQSGIKVEELRLLSPYPEGALLQEIEIGLHHPPQLRSAIEVINQNVTQLNNLLYDHQDYCLIAEIQDD